MSINRVVISGNLTRDPEMRATASGTQVMGFGVAVNDRRRNPQTGEWEDYPNFVDCTMFGNRAEAVSRYLHKGSRVAIEGKLRHSSWEAKDGTKRSKLEVIVDEIVFMDAQQGYQPAQPAYPAQQGYQQPACPQPAQQGYQQPQPAYPPQGYAQPAPQQGYQQPPAQQPQPAPAPQPAQPPLPQQPTQPAQQPPVPDVYDEDIPF